MTDVQAAPASTAPPSSRFFVAGANRPVARSTSPWLSAALLVVLGCVRAAVHRGVLDSAVRHVADDLPRWVTSLFDAAYGLGSVVRLVVVVAVVVHRTATRAAAADPADRVGRDVRGRRDRLVRSPAPGCPSSTRGRCGPAPRTASRRLRVALVTSVLLALRPWRGADLPPLPRRCRRSCSASPPGRSASPARPTSSAPSRSASPAAERSRSSSSAPPPATPTSRQVATSLRGPGVSTCDDLRFADRAAVGCPDPHARPRRAAPAPDQGLRPRRHRRPAGRPLVAHAALPRPEPLPDRPASSWSSTRPWSRSWPTARASRVDHVVAAAESSGDAVLVLGAPGAPLSDAAEIDDARLRRVLGCRRPAARAGLCPRRAHARPHRASPTRRPVLSDFSGRLDRRHRRPALAGGRRPAHQPGARRRASDRAVDAALAGLGTDGVGAAQPYLQRAALPRSLRSDKECKAADRSTADDDHRPHRHRAATAGRDRAGPAPGPAADRVHPARGVHPAHHAHQPRLVDRSGRRGSNAPGRGS